MWDLLKKTDIEQAKQELELRRAETLRRHAEECQILDADQVELETLNHLVDIFTQKFPKPMILSHGPVASALPNQDIGGRTSPGPRNQNHRDQPRTNFAMFTRAMSRG